jgi:hypothetical protein
MILSDFGSEVREENTLTRSKVSLFPKFPGTGGSIDRFLVYFGPKDEEDLYTFAWARN